MKMSVDQIPAQTRWAMSTKGLTSALAAHLNVLYGIVGKGEYSKTIGPIWAEMGKTTAEEIKSSGQMTDNAQLVAHAAVNSCICAMGPEYRIEQVESSVQRTVMRITECPWKNRMRELDISHDLLSACDTVFWDHFTENLNPEVTMRHGKQMHRGDAYCEWIFEAKI